MVRRRVVPSEASCGNAVCLGGETLRSGIKHHRESVTMTPCRENHLKKIAFEWTNQSLYIVRSDSHTLLGVGSG